MGSVNRPAINIEIYRVDNGHKAAVWNIFRKYHYLNTDLHPAATQYVGVYDGRLVCHTGIIQMPMKKGRRRVHRLVVLPDYQGCGVGTAFITEVAKIEESNGYEVNLTTTTPAIANALKRRSDWVLVRCGRAENAYKGYNRYKDSNEAAHLVKSASGNRFTYSFWHKRGC